MSDNNDKGGKPKSELSTDVEKLVEGLADKIVTAISEAKGGVGTPKDVQQLKSKILFHGHTKEIEYPSDLSALTKEEKIVTFFKALIYSNADPASNQVLRALVEGTDAEGGYLVPEEFRAEVFRILPDVAVMRRIARVIPMATDTLNLNTLSARPTAYWTSEYASKSTTSAEFGRVTLNPAKLVCLLPVSDELLADANINLVQYIIELFTEAIATVEDKAFFTGSGTGEPRGINQETLSSSDVGGSLGFDDVIGLLDLVPQKITQSPRTAFVAHRRVKRLLRLLKDTNNNYLWRDGGAAASNVGETKRLPDTLYGYPFYEQNDLAQSELYFGDWSYYIIGDRQQIVVKTTTEGGDAWRRDATEIKAVERVDGAAVLTGAFAKLTNIN